MIGLDRLLKMKGVKAAGQFTDDGRVIRAVGEMPQEAMDAVARMCATQTTVLDSQVKKLGELAGQDWSPFTGWGVWGGKYAIAVVGNTGVIVDTRYADFNQLMVDLLQSEPTGARQMNY